MKRSSISQFLITLFVIPFLFAGCTKATNEWWLEMNYLDETQQTDFRLNMPITIMEDNTLSGLGILEVRQLIEGEPAGFPECLAGETNGVRVRGEISVVGSVQNDKILVESLEPTGGPGAFSLVYYCVKGDIERDAEIYSLDPNSEVGQAYANFVINALYIFSEGMLKYPLDQTDKFSGQDGEGFTFILHRGNLPESKKVPTPFVKSN